LIIGIRKNLSEGRADLRMMRILLRNLQVQVDILSLHLQALLINRQLKQKKNLKIIRSRNYIKVLTILLKYLAHQEEKELLLQIKQNKSQNWSKEFLRLEALSKRTQYERKAPTVVKSSQKVYKEGLLESRTKMKLKKLSWQNWILLCLEDKIFLYKNL